jgi:hypothetical protein
MSIAFSSRSQRQTLTTVQWVSPSSEGSSRRERMSTSTFSDLNQKILQKKVCAAEKFSIPVTSFVTSVASFVPDVTSFVPDVASFIPDVASFIPDVASFVTSVASFDTSVASFVTDVAGFSNSVSNHLSYRSIKESIGRQRRIF